MDQPVVFIPKYNRRNFFISLLIIGLLCLILTFKFNSNTTLMLLLILLVFSPLVILMQEVKRIEFSDQITVEWRLLPTQIFPYSVFRDFVKGRGIALGALTVIHSGIMQNQNEFNEIILNLIKHKKITMNQFDKRFDKVSFVLPVVLAIVVPVLLIPVVPLVAILSMTTQINIFFFSIPIIVVIWFINWLLYKLENVVRWQR